MPKPIKLRDFLAALRAADPSIACSTQRGKGSHYVLSKSYGNETRSFLGPCQSKIISLYGLPKDVFQKNKTKKKSE